VADSSWKDDVLRGSVLDRLIAGEGSGGSSSSYGYVGVRELRDSVALHLEWLLNSKRWCPWDLEAFKEARESNLTYGLPDLSTYSWRSGKDAGRIGEFIKEAIRRFEPRLQPQSIKVEVLPAGGVDDFSVGFRIHGILNVDPIREPVTFNSDMDMTTNEIHVSGEF